MSVEVDLNEILHHPGMRQRLDIEVPRSSELEEEFIAPVSGHLVFTNTGNVLVVQGEVQTTLRSPCPRCVVDVDTPVTAVVDEEFAIDEGEIVGLADEEMGRKDPTFQALVHAGILNVTELVRQAVILDRPNDPLCREDCRGLCPQCGTNWNTNECSCEPEVDSPFAALSSILQQDEEKTSENE